MVVRDGGRPQVKGGRSENGVLEVLTQTWFPLVEFLVIMQIFAVYIGTEAFERTVGDTRESSDGWVG